MKKRLESRLRQYRRAFNLTQTELAQMLREDWIAKGIKRTLYKVMQQHISNWERGVCSPPKGVKEMLARRFELPLNVLFPEDKNRKEQR